MKLRKLIKMNKSYIIAIIRGIIHLGKPLALWSIEISSLITWNNGESQQLCLWYITNISFPSRCQHGLNKMLDAIRRWYRLTCKNRRILHKMALGPMWRFHDQVSMPVFINYLVARCRKQCCSAPRAFSHSFFPQIISVGPKIIVIFSEFDFPPK